MDLYLSTATTLGIAAVSLLCAAGYFWLLRSRIRQLARSRRRRMGEPSGEPLHRLEVGTAVILRGKIVISSGPIERLDDGAAAAAASYSVARRQHWLARP